LVVTEEKKSKSKRLCADEEKPPTRKIGYEDIAYLFDKDYKPK